MSRSPDSYILVATSMEVAENASSVFPPALEGEFVLYEASVWVVTLLSICYGSISILAVTGNSLVIWAVMGSRRMQSSATNWLLANLALADIIIGLFTVPFQFQAALRQRWDLPHFMCAFCPFVQTLSVNVSVFTLTAIAVRRFRAVVLPLKEARITRQHARLTLWGIWALGLSLAIPMAMALKVVQVPDDLGVVNATKPFCAFSGLPEPMLMWYRRLLVMLQYFAPLCVISAMYGLLGYRLWGLRTPGNAQNQRDATLLRNKKRVIKMLILVVALFALCWLPLQVYNVLQNIFPKINEYKYINIIWFGCDMLAMSNSVCNPFVYGIYNEKFRRRFSSRCSLCSRLLHLPARQPLSHTEVKRSSVTSAHIPRKNSARAPVMGEVRRASENVHLKSFMIKSTPCTSRTSVQTSVLSTAIVNNSRCDSV